ncbi:MAG TPA: serine/threonine-protein kinase, partial [Kofleriaceae bacterium]|nr:serine/threonine-protein kinase [Kofleriaceae bacterium]
MSEQDPQELRGEAATAVDNPLRKRASPSLHGDTTAPLPRGPAPPATTGARDSVSADAAAFTLTLRQAEIARTRRIVPVLIVLALSAGALVPIAGGDPVAIEIVYLGLACATIAIGYLYWLTGDQARFIERRIAVVYGVSIATVFTAVYYWGIFSPAAAIVALGIFFVTLGRSLRVGVGLYAFAASCQAALAIAVIGGFVRDRGLVQAGDASVREQVIEQAMLQIVFAVTYLIARATRMHIDSAVGEHDRAVRAVAQRDALLVEARADLDRALKIGGPGRYSEQVVGSYRLGVLIGRGAMGDVYEGVHVETGEPAAVKLINAATLGTPGQLTRFYREARVAATLVSPHVVQLREVGADDSPIPYLAMERLRGHDLAQILRDQRRLPIGEIVELVHQVARGLEVARAAGIVHRDIKPQNLFRSELPRARLWKILDFGVSKLGDDVGTLTKDHAIGTPMYMAPEQARGDTVDHRTDVFALASVCYRALTGQPPYAGRDVPTVLYNVVHKVPQRPGELAKLTLDVDRVMAIAMAKPAAERFATAVEFADAFAAAAGGKLGRDLRERADDAIAARPW